MNALKFTKHAQEFRMHSDPFQIFFVWPMQNRSLPEVLVQAATGRYASQSLNTLNFLRW